MEKKLKKNISEISRISKKMPKTINEAINFNDQDMEYSDNFEEPEVQAPVAEPAHVEEPKAEKVGLDTENFINNTRKQALQIMAQLADDPQSQTYDIAKKIWMLCDKACNEPKETSDAMPFEK